MRTFRAPLLALAFLSTAAVFAQAVKPIDFGVKGGISLPSFFWAGDDGWNASTYFAFQGEAYFFACANLSPTFGIELDAGYHGKGCSVSASDATMDWYMDYLELPVWAKWSMRFPTGTSAYGGFGAYAAYFFGGRYDFSAGVAGWDGSGPLTSGNADIPTEVRPLDVGAVFVCGMESRKWLGEMRFSVGFLKSMDFTPPSDFTSPGERGSLNSGLDFLVGYKF